MKVTVCELSNDMKQFEKEWDQLVAHCQTHNSELILLPEMPFYSWIANRPSVNKSAILEAVRAHEKWLGRIEAFGDAIVAYSKPWVEGDNLYNSAFIWSRENGHQKVHTKHFFPEEEGFYEDTWFDREPISFDPTNVKGLKIGFLLCTEIWFTQYTRKYGLDGIDLLLVPRATGQSSISQWLRWGQTSAVIGGCYCLSSNRSGMGVDGFCWGGTGWITQPIDGKLLGKTSRDTPFLTLDIDLGIANQAKKEYPLYVRE